MKWSLIAITTIAISDIIHYLAYPMLADHICISVSIFDAFWSILQ